MRKFFAIILALGGLFFLTALAAPGELSGGKVAAIVIGAVLLLLSWTLWRRLPKPQAAAAVPKLESARSTESTRRQDDLSNRGALVKAKLAYEDLKHLQGVPGVRPKQRVTLLLTKEGIRLVDPKSWESTYYTIGWAAFRGVATADSQSLRDEGQLNSVRAGAVARGSSLGSAVALETAGLLLDRSPLIINFQLVPNDPVTSSVVFSTWLNEEIAVRILAHRTQLIAGGDLTFEAPESQSTNPR